MPNTDVRALAQLQYDYTYDMYRQKARENSANSAGLERYLYKLFGPELMASIAFAIDPWSHFRTTLFKVSPVNRTTNLLCIQKEYRWTQLIKQVIIRAIGTYPVWQDLSTSTIDAKTPVARQTQSAIYGFRKDTTNRTRPSGVEYGEFELFVPKFDSQPTSIVYKNHTKIDNSADGEISIYDGTSTYKNLRIGPTAVLNKSDVDYQAVQARSRATTAMNTYGLNLVRGCMPLSRRFNLPYQIGELKDFPMMIRGSFQTWYSLERALGKKQFLLLIQGRLPVGNKTVDLLRTYARDLRLEWLDVELAKSYLNFKFGWQSFLQALTQLIDRPARISKEVNSLIERSGQPTTLRRSMAVPLKQVSGPGISVDNMDNEVTDSVTSETLCLARLRVMLNVTFRFPDVDVPKLRRTLFWHKLGVDLAYVPSDLYDLIPWTWLIDWFSGLGDYIHAMNEIYQDPSVINYGFLTYREDFRTQHCKRIHIDTWESVTILRVGKTVWTRSYNSFNNTYSHVYQMRKSVTSLSGVKSLSTGGLSGTQQTILAALLHSRNPSQRST